jgi:hypothetical protein
MSSAKSGVWKDETPVKILIPLGDLANEIEHRLPFAAAAKDLPKGRKQPGWKRAFRAALVEAARDLDGVSEEQILKAVKAYRERAHQAGVDRCRRSRRSDGVEASLTRRVVAAGVAGFKAGVMPTNARLIRDWIENDSFVRARQR